jgi:hypothetical protein
MLNYDVFIVAKNEVLHTFKNCFTHKKSSPEELLLKFQRTYEVVFLV